MISDSFPHVCVIGLGYIGLPTASILASQGLQVTGVDINEPIVHTINEGKTHFAEKDLDVLVHSAVHSKKLHATMQPVAADVYIIAVPTPFQQDHQPDLSFVQAATLSIAPFLRPGNLVILESTSPVGTTEQMAKWLHEARADLDFASFPKKTQAEPVCLAYCPERVLPGNIMQELVLNDRIIGGIDECSASKAKVLYECFCQGKILLTDCRTAEMVKLTENAFRDVNIAFANELANVCDHLNINVWDLIKLANHHPRVNILQPGPGVGGHCIAVDPWFIVASAPQETALIQTARAVNDARPEKILAKIHRALVEFPKAKIACLGLAFKANVDDLRESPAMEIVTQLARETTNAIYVVEPFIQKLPKVFQDYPQVRLEELQPALKMADILVILVNHEVFQKEVLLLPGKIIIDTRGILRND